MNLQQIAKLALKLNKRVNHPILRSVFFDSREAWITDLETEVSISFRGSFEGAINAEYLSDRKNIRIETSEQEGKALLSFDGGSAIVPFAPLSDAPLRQDPLALAGSCEDEISLDPDDVLAVKAVSTATSKEEMRLQLHGVLISHREAAATDGHRLHILPLSCNPKNPIYLPESVLSLLPKDSRLWIRVGSSNGGTKRKVVIHDGNMTVINLHDERRFPDYGKVQTRAFSHCVVVNAENLIKALASVPKEKGKARRFTLASASDHLTITAGNCQSETKSAVPAAGSIPSIRLNADYLSDACKMFKAIGSKRVLIHSNNGEGQIRIVGDSFAESSTACAVIMPLRS